jgi:hypothetical protein
VLSIADSRWSFTGAHDPVKCRRTIARHRAGVTGYQKDAA